MFWSISNSRLVNQCPRQWYYKNCLASAQATRCPERRKAYLLGKLQSISAWRGTLVDKVLSDTLIRAVNAKRGVTFAELRGHARSLFDRQLAFAQAHRLFEPGMKPSKMEEFAAFHCMEYEGKISDEDIVQAWCEIEQALTNLCQMRQLFETLQAAEYLIAQRALSFQHSGVMVRAQPDVMAFYRDLPPLIVDWKVHTFGIQNAWLQLGVYALALSRCNPHRDFPESLKHWGETDVRLVEVQLLTNVMRGFVLAEEHVERIEVYIAASATDILYATNGEPNDQLVASDFPVAINPKICQRCPFKAICWEDTV